MKQGLAAFIFAWACFGCGGTETPDGADMVRHSVIWMEDQHGHAVGVMNVVASPDGSLHSHSAVMRVEIPDDQHGDIFLGSRLGDHSALDHGYDGSDQGHWGHGFDPWVEPASHLAAYAWESVDNWNSVGVGSQMMKGVQDGDCDIVSGEISVCGRNYGFVTHGYTIGVNAAGIAAQYFNSDGHIRASVVEVCQNCGYSTDFMYYLMKHEMGHSMGLGHSTDCGSVMSACSTRPRWINQHDRDTLWRKYNHYP